MKGITSLSKLLSNMAPSLHAGSYVFSTIENIEKVPRGIAVCEFQEAEGTTIILEKTKADELGLLYI